MDKDYNATMDFVTVLDSTDNDVVLLITANSGDRLENTRMCHSGVQMVKHICLIWIM